MRMGDEDDEHHWLNESGDDDREAGWDRDD